MNKFDKAIAKVEKYDGPISIFLILVIPGLGGGLAINNGAGAASIIFILSGVVINLLHYMLTIKIISFEPGEDTESLWFLRFGFIAIYFISVPILYLHFCELLSLSYKLGSVSSMSSGQ